MSSSAVVDLVVFGLGAPSKFSPSILGSGVGGHAARIAAEQGLSVRAVARNPAKYEALFPFGGKVSLVQGDVTNRESVVSALTGAKACLFAVQAADSATADEVDRDALALVAEECAKAQCKLVVISSVFVSPKHRFNPLRIMFNTIVKWNMMDAKWEGEQRVRATQGLKYVIIRPGALNDAAPLENEYKIGQGDALTFAIYPIPKIDVGRIAVAAAVDENCYGVAFEIAGSKSPNKATVQGLFDGLKKD